MKFCSHCGKELMDAAVVCPHCGCSVSEQKKDRVNGLLVFFSFIIPLLGIILFIVQREETPRAAKIYLASALYSILIPVGIFLISMFTAMGLGR